MAFDEPVQHRRLPDARGSLDEHDAGTLRRDLVEHAVEGIELMPPAGEQAVGPCRQARPVRAA